MPLSITGARSELGGVLKRRAPHGQVASAHINLAGQQANTLLHDGHAWRDFPRTMLSATRRALRSAGAAHASIFVHASFAFVRAVERGANGREVGEVGKVAEPLRSCVQAILESEALVLGSGLPACVVRLGYLYGPESADLRAYRTAFRLGRPYWSGEPGALQHHLHLWDAASALLAAARAGEAGEAGEAGKASKASKAGRPGKPGKPGKAGTTYYATDGHAVSFRQFMDAFAHRVGRRRPLHLPLRSRLLARVVIREEHMQQTALGMPARAPSPRVPGWKPQFADYRAGLDQVIEAWRETSAA